MRGRDLQRLYDYNYWANKQLLNVVSQLTPEQFIRSVAGSYGSVRNTLVHVLSAEWGWLDRCGGQERGERLNPQDYPSVDSLVQAWTRVEEYVRGFLSGLKDEDLTRDIESPLGVARNTTFRSGTCCSTRPFTRCIIEDFDFLLYVGETGT